MSSLRDSHAKLTDPNTNGIRSSEENLTRAGKSFSSTHVNVSIVAADSIYILRKSAPGVVIQHDYFSVVSGTDEKNTIEVQYLEGVVWTPGGTEVPLDEFNLNRIAALNFPSSSEAFAVHAVDVSDDGLVYKEFSTIGSTALDTQLSYLDPEVWYAQKITNTGTNTVICDIALAWQELQIDVL